MELSLYQNYDKNLEKSPVFDTLFLNKKQKPSGFLNILYYVLIFRFNVEAWQNSNGCWDKKENSLVRVHEKRFLNIFNLS